MGVDLKAKRNQLYDAAHCREHDRGRAGLQAGVNARLIEGLEPLCFRWKPPGAAPVLAWPLACGSAVAERTRALDFTNGVLRIEVPDVGWRAELQLLAPRYVAAINRYVTDNVARVEFILAPRR